MKLDRKILVGLIVVLSLCICVTVIGTSAFYIVGAPSVSATRPIAEPSPIATPAASLSTAEALQRTEIPARDLYQIAPRLRKDTSFLTPVPTLVPRSYKVGDKNEFFVIQNASSGKYRSVTATLQIANSSGLFWVEEGMTFDQAALKKSADLFDQTIYPTNRKYFGEQGVGLDGDVRVHILNTRFADAAGYFSSEDKIPRKLFAYSNERNIIYMNIEAVRLGTNEYDGDLAHEFQHLIHSYQARNKTGWIDEGMSDLAMKLNGFQVLGISQTFGRNPNTQLNTWSSDPQTVGGHYSAAYLFFNYTALRFGPEFSRAVIHASREGTHAVQSVLDERAGGMRFEDLFADWAVTNHLNDPSVENGKYAYSNESTFRISREPVVSQFPLTLSQKMNQQATNYFALQPANGDVTIVFTGTLTTKLIAADAHGGKWMWYSNRADLANMHLTREFDLSRASKATLNFWVWYDIEKNFDYAYVEASADGGKTWDVLRALSSSTEDPNGASYGPAFTGRSGTTSENAPAQWLEERVDLSPYAGKKILVRFEYITDDAYNTPGLAIDDIAIPEINFVDGIENGENGWQAKGFVRIDNVLPQKFIVQLVKRGATPQVIRIPLDSSNRGRFTIEGFGKDITRAELIVNAFAPTTTEPTQYEFSVVPK